MPQLITINNTWVKIQRNSCKIASLPGGKRTMSLLKHNVSLSPQRSKDYGPHCRRKIVNMICTTHQLQQPWDPLPYSTVTWVWSLLAEAPKNISQQHWSTTIDEEVCRTLASDSVYQTILLYKQRLPQVVSWPNFTHFPKFCRTPVTVIQSLPFVARWS
jgi:hypothetical protein